ncbi:hypothetical protein L226DRAFT_528922 [Lentinus tigrinus ALCF2SS1-7]|uniref:Uncharacterized protein n=1 Tax=Lentinus tigrinus ALCF2SS1-6 TaxID=1328759 RepID=A0A5C2SN53_9APHY|nr:hypothetical protein L227DRAFT_571163 [Lentinus tigrinus ALCF2SS1-6]RPD82794.1 hypothetical protein L226DRAFT_528922 [Lentinus tigrinus ALCF2SS1-7]
MLYWRKLPLFASFVLWTHHAAGLSANRTIDDELGDLVTGTKPLYFPEGVWNQGMSCTICNIGPSQVDLSQTFDGTWHDATYFPGQSDLEVHASFTGTAVYVYFLVAGTFTDTTTFMNTTFFIDDEPVGQFTHSPDALPDISYRVPVYMNTTLANSDHILVMRATGVNKSLILFDYIEYTVETPDKTSSLSSTPSPTVTILHTLPPLHKPVAAIAGGTVGGVVGLAAIVALVVFLLRRRRSQQSRPRSILTMGEPEVKSDDELLGRGISGYPSGPWSPSSLVSGGIPYGGSRGSIHQSQGYELPHPDSSASQQQAELLQRIGALETQVRSRKMGQTPDNTENVASEANLRGLQDEIAALRGALAGLRTELVDERRLGEEPLPQYEANML